MSDDPVIEWFKRKGIKPTRENYLGLCYPDGTPDPWTAEHEAELPPELQWRSGPPPKEFVGYSLAQWAQYFVATDLARIDSTIRSGLIAGLDNTEIARKVIGSVDLQGIDGVTEITRRAIVRLGRTVITKKRKG